MTKQVIIVDVDDVLSATAQGFADFSNKRWGNTHRAEDYTEAWAEFWKVSIEEALKRREEYYASNVIGEFAHYSEAVSVLRRLAQTYTLLVLTPRPKHIKDLTDTWIEAHFPGIFSGIYYAGIWDGGNDSIKHRLNATKAVMCKELGASYLIDDQLKHCIGVLDEGITPLLFGGNPSQYSKTVPEGIVRVENWLAVEEYFNAKG